jgi:hypothetical protein
MSDQEDKVFSFLCRTRAANKQTNDMEVKGKLRGDQGRGKGPREGDGGENARSTLHV